MLTALALCSKIYINVSPRRQWVLKKGLRRNEALDYVSVYNFVALKIINPVLLMYLQRRESVDEPEYPPLKKVFEPYKMRHRDGSFVNAILEDRTPK